MKHLVRFLRRWQFVAQFGTLIGIEISIMLLLMYGEWLKAAELLPLLWALWILDEAPNEQSQP